MTLLDSTASTQANETLTTAQGGQDLAADGGTEVGNNKAGATHSEQAISQGKPAFSGIASEWLKA